MRDSRPADELSTEELTRLLYAKKRQNRRQRLQRMSASGRLIETVEPPISEIPDLPAGGSYRAPPGTDSADNRAEPLIDGGSKRAQWRWVASKFLLLLEISAVVGLITVMMSLWRTSAELNRELAQIQRTESQSLALPTPTATPIIDVVILPGGHKPPIDGVPPVQGEAGDIPAHLLPAINAYVPPPIPTPGVEQARRIQIPAINVDSPVVQGMYDWEQLKKGVAQHIGSASPGDDGNMILAGHNDIYGEVFRYLDKLAPGDEIIVSTQRQTYTYVVRDTRLVDPIDVSVLGPTDFATTTLISCYPYRVNTQRIIVFADLVDSA